MNGATGVQASIVHRMPGRTRLSIAQRRGNDAFFAMLRQRLAEVDGVSAVRVNPAAASVVIEHAGSIDQIVQAAGAPPLFQLQGAGSAQPAAKAAEPLPVPRLVTGRNINPMFMTGSAFTLVGVLQSLRGQVLVPALSAFWYAADAFQRAHQKGPRRTGQPESQARAD